MRNKGGMKTIKGQPSKHRGRALKFYDSRKKLGPMAITSHIPWMVWPPVTDEEIRLIPATQPTLALTSRFI